ncbi:MAG: response regulator [Desulfovibrio sp.]|nr:response regulator [Desulfovibrio sp.]
MNYGHLLRLTAGKLLLTCLASALMVVVSYHLATGIVEKHLKMNVRETLELTESILNAHKREASIMLLSAAYSLQNRMDTGQSQEQIRQYLVGLADWFTRARDDALVFVDIFGYIRGEFISARAKELPNQPANYDPTQRQWYAAAQRDPGRVVLSMPFVDSRTGNIVVSVSKVLFNSSGDQLGVLATIMRLPETAIVQYPEDLSPVGAGYRVLLTPDLRLATYPDRKYIGRSMRDLSPTHASIADLLEQGQKEVSGVDMLNSKGERSIAFYKKMDNGWYLGAVMPFYLYYHDVRVMAAAMILLGLILTSFTCVFLIRFSAEKARAEEKTESKSFFLSRLSHEIRTPLNSIIGMAELVSRKNLNYDVREYISIIKRSGIALLGIVNDILDFSQAESGKLELVSEPYNFPALIADVINITRARLAETKSINFFAHIECAVPKTLIGDGARVRQILLNLLSNAAKYTREGFIALDVRLTACRNGTAELHFLIKDTGIGIRKEDMDKLFSLFTRLETHRDYKVEGAGLGLSIVNTFCRAMNGNISVTSSYGKGSIFAAYIVQHYENEERSATVAEPRQKHVLLYEMREMYMAYAALAFKDLGIFRMTRVDSLSRFISKFRNGGYDYALLPARHVEECVNALGREALAEHLIVVRELGDVSKGLGFRQVTVPVHSLSLADALNGVPESANTGWYGPEEAVFSAPGARALVVDDMPTNLRVASELLSQYGMQVDTCESGKEALTLVSHNRYDIVFMDHMMPEMDGMETTRAIRGLGGGKDEYFLKLPVIALTANVTAEQNDLFMQNGFDDLLTKPVRMLRLDAVLRKWLPKEKHVVLSGLLESSTDERTRIGEIPGVDVVSGLRNSGGRPETYRDILTDFCRDAASRNAQIRAAWKQGDYTLLTILVHALKGSARVIGASRFADLAEELEKRLRDGDGVMIRREVENFLEALSVLLNSIRAALPPEQELGDTAQKEPVDDAALSLEDMKRALDNMDAETVNNLLSQYQTLSFNQATAKFAGELERLILTFDYDKAVEKINEVLSGNPSARKPVGQKDKDPRAVSSAMEETSLTDGE